MARKRADDARAKAENARAARAAYGVYPPPSLRVADLFPGAPANEPAAAPGTAVEVGAVGWEAEAAAMMLHHGVVVLRDPAFVAGQAAIKDAFDAALAGMPEFKPAYAARAYGDDNDTRFVLGSFSALGNASSFHNPFVRRLREAAMARVAPVAAAIAGSMRNPADWVFEQVMDRVLYRAPNITPGRETWHMDLPKDPRGLSPKDQKLVFGGWYSVGGEQAFSCWPRSHLHTKVGAVKGFSKLLDYQKPFAEANKRRIDVPPGHILLFDESIVHEVLGGGGRKDEATRRLFLGWTIRQGAPGMPSLLPNTDEVIRTQGIASLKSGQVPYFYSDSQKANYLVSQYRTLRAYSDAAIDPELIKAWPKAIASSTYSIDLDADGRPVPGNFVWLGKNLGFSARPAPPNGTIPFMPILAPVLFPSLEEYKNGTEMYPAYTADERHMYRPERVWNLHSSVQFITDGTVPPGGDVVHVQLPGGGGAAAAAAAGGAAAAAAAAALPAPVVPPVQYGHVNRPYIFD
jgi:hypothetical protein